VNPPCTVKLDLFEGPLDLLLHLIKRSEVEITDIPIARITDQYLATLEELPDLDLDSAGEYLVMASTLMHIKSRMLLPSAPDEDEASDEDPRSELVQQLLEYQRYREAALELGSRLLLERDVFAPAGEPIPPRDELPEDEPPVRDASVGDLLEALRGVLQRVRQPTPHAIERPGVTVGECVHRILARFALDERLEFSSLFDAAADRGVVIVTFLALLELIRLRVLRALQSDRFGPIDLELACADLGEAAARARDLGEHGAPAWGGGDGDGPGSGDVG